MNKKELISLVAEDTGFTQRDVSAVIDSMVKTVEAAVAGGESVYLSGFGIFSPRERAARQGRNPRTGETAAVPAEVVPRFKPGREFRDKVRKQPRGGAPFT